VLDFREFLKAEVQLLRIYLLRMSRNSDGQRAACVLLPGTQITNERTAKLSDYPNSAGSTESVRYINPDSLNNNPAFTNVVVVEGNVKTVHIGGQDALDASGEIVGKGDIVAQTEQILAKVRAALEAGGARPEHIIQWNIYVVEGQSLQAGFAAFFQQTLERVMNLGENRIEMRIPQSAWFPRDLCVLHS
jgi:enamine deaminase RidA (YjgF/YER057c/UK114 family)